MATSRQPSIGRYLGLLASGVIGAFISGITARIGAYMTGFTHDPYGIAGLFYIICAWLVGGLLALIIIVTGEVRRWMLTCTVLLSLIGTPLVMFAGGAISFPMLTRYGERIEKARQEKYNALRLQLQRDPEIALREKWYLKGNEKGQIFSFSFGNSDVPYTLEQLKRLCLLIESPGIRDQLFRHPSCDATFLSEHFQEACDRAARGEVSMFDSIVSNPNTPRELLERVAVQNTLRHGIAESAQEALKKRDL
jgi:hypothetical protein